MSRKSINKSKVEDFEPKRKNPISLGSDSNLDKDLKPIIINDLTTNLELSIDGTFIRNELVTDTLFTDQLTTGLIVGDATGEVFIEADSLHIGFGGGYKLISTGMDSNFFPSFKFNNVVDANDWGEIAGIDYVGSLQIQTVEGASDTGNTAKLFFKSNAYTAFTVDKGQSDYSGSLGYVKLSHGVREHGRINMSTEYKLELQSSTNTDLVLSTQGSGDLNLTPASGKTTVTVSDGDEANTFHITLDGATNRAFSIFGEVENYTTLRMYEMGGNSTADYFNIGVLENGETSITTVDASGADAHLSLDPDGELNLTPANQVKSDAPLKIKEAVGAVADTAAYGQLWVKTATPNELYFTTDAGNDIQLTSGTSTAGGGGGTTRWSFTFGGYGPSNSSSTNYYTSSYGGSYYYWSASDSSPTTVAYNRRPFWTAPADGTITRITINLHSTSASDDIKFYVFKGAFADGEYTTDITLLATSDASGLDTANRNFTIDTTFSSSNDFTAGQQLWVFFKKETNNATMRHYFSGTVSGEFD